MIIDDCGAEELFTHLASKGYSGSLEDWRSVLDEQSYITEVRLFRENGLKGWLHDYPQALEFSLRLCASAQQRFKTAYANHSPRLRISFGLKEAVPAGSLGVRLDGLWLSFEVRDHYVEIRCQLSANGRDRRDTTIRFVRNKKGYTYEY